jgi:hypothetical protein
MQCFPVNPAVRILLHGMKQLILLLSSFLLVALTGTSCKISANPDVRQSVEVTGPSGLSTIKVYFMTLGSDRSGAGSTDVTAVNSAASETGDPSRIDSEPSELRREGELEMAALARAYPDRIRDLAFRNDDWALRIDDTWYYWARGRLLPEELRDRWEEYASYRFYAYSLDLPPIPQLDEESKQRLKQRLDQAEESPPRRHEGFLADL